jgi:hypothetical protein
MLQNCHWSYKIIKNCFLSNGTYWNILTTSYFFKKKTCVYIYVYHIYISYIYIHIISAHTKSRIFYQRWICIKRRQVKLLRGHGGFTASHQLRGRPHRINFTSCGIETTTITMINDDDESSSSSSSSFPIVDG